MHHAAMIDAIHEAARRTLSKPDWEMMRRLAERVAALCEAEAQVNDALRITPLRITPQQEGDLFLVAKHEDMGFTDVLPCATAEDIRRYFGPQAAKGPANAKAVEAARKLSLVQPGLRPYQHQVLMDLGGRRPDPVLVPRDTLKAWRLALAYGPSDQVSTNIVKEMNDALFSTRSTV